MSESEFSECRVRLVMTGSGEAARPIVEQECTDKGITVSIAPISMMCTRDGVPGFVEVEGFHLELARLGETSGDRAALLELARRLALKLLSVTGNANVTLYADNRSETIFVGNGADIEAR